MTDPRSITSAQTSPDHNQHASLSLLASIASNLVTVPLNATITCRPSSCGPGFFDRENNIIGESAFDGGRSVVAERVKRAVVAALLLLGPSVWRGLGEAWVYNCARVEQIDSTP